MSDALATERQRRVARTLRDRGPLAPPALRARVEAQVERARERRRPARRWHMALAGVAAAALAIAGVVLPAIRGDGLDVGEAAALATRDISAGAPRAEPGRPRLLAARFEGVAYPNWEPEFGWRAAGQRSDHVDGRHTQTVFYEHEGHRVGYTIVSGSALEPPDDATRITRDGIAMSVYRDHHGRDVAVFERNGRTCIVSGHVIRRSTIVKLAAWTGEDRADLRS